jgi:5'(3')-deoxyribonucleotidase
MKIRTVYFDLDGCVAQFVRGALAVHGSTLKFTDITAWDMHEKMGLSEEAMYAPMGFDFWSSLDTHWDGMALLQTYLSKWTGGQVSLLSTPINTPGCRDGKTAWVEKHLPDYTARLFLGKDKSVHAGPDRLLIDDADKNVEKFRGAGGKAVLVPRLWNNERRECDSAGDFDPCDLYYRKIVPILLGA